MIDEDRGILPDASVDGPPFGTLNRADYWMPLMPCKTSIHLESIDQGETPPERLETVLVARCDVADAAIIKSECLPPARMVMDTSVSGHICCTLGQLPKRDLTPFRIYAKLSIIIWEVCHVPL